MMVRTAQFVDPSHISPAQAAALWKIGFLPPEQIQTLAIEWLERGEDKGSLELAALALDPPNNEFSREAAFEAALAELGVDLPDRNRAVFVTLELYLRAIIEGRVPVKAGMAVIDELYERRGEAELRHPNRRPDDPQSFVGEELGLEHLYTWYRELQDSADGSPLFYYNELPPEQLIAKFEEELIAEASVLHSHLCGAHPDIGGVAPS